MARDIDDIVDAASDPVVTFVVTPSTISSELPWSAKSRLVTLPTHVVTLVHVQICVHISLMCAPDCARQTWPWLLEGQHTLNIVSVDLLAGDRIDDRRLDTEERK